ncbi:MAG: NUDIX hydrolase [Parcubacteria group bacterium GW2011_GWA2_47_21]|nr:MAG: NUDIX hydrolase [Parcubacteria group bacterium GW2011_GWA2_47_21]
MTNEIEKVLYKAVLVFLVKDGKVCLPVKKLKIGAGKRNGFGGGVEKDESWKNAAAREMVEEAEIKVWPKDLRKIAYLFCRNQTETGLKFTSEIVVFATTFWLGEPKETKEMGPPEWFQIEQLPQSELMPGDKGWLPETLAEKILRNGKKIPMVEIWYGPRQETITRPIRMIWLKPSEEKS